jgi:ADP-ribose pyrophosphatase
VTYRLRFAHDDVRVLNRERVFEGYFAVERLTIEHRAFGGGWAEPVVREVFERGNAVGVLPYEVESDSVILVEQFRPGALRDRDSPWMLELVAGIVEADESDEDVVRREADEEAGCELAELVPVASYYPSAGACSEHLRLFCGRVVSAGVGEVKGLDGEGEDILVHRLGWEDALQMLRADRINNGHTLVALQWLALHRESLRSRWLGGAEAAS